MLIYICLIVLYFMLYINKKLVKNLNCVFIYLFCDQSYNISLAYIA